MEYPNGWWFIFLVTVSEVYMALTLGNVAALENPYDFCLLVLFWTIGLSLAVFPDHLCLTVDETVRYQILWEISYGALKGSASLLWSLRTLQKNNASPATLNRLPCQVNNSRSGGEKNNKWKSWRQCMLSFFLSDIACQTWGVPISWGLADLIWGLKSGVFSPHKM